MKSKNVNDEFLRKRKERQRRIRRRRLFISFIVFLVLSLITGVILCLTVLFPINKINISGSKVYNKSELSSAFEDLLGDNIFTVSEKSTLEKLKKQLPFIEEINFKRTLPDTLEIDVKDAKEFSCYEFKGKFYTVSQSGWVLASYDEQPENVFKIISNLAKCKVGTLLELKSQDDFEALSEIIGSLQTNKLDIDYVDITDSVNLRVGIENRFDVDFGTSNFLEEKTRHLKSMVDNIPNDKTGKINLSMWNSQNTQGTFVENDRK